MPFSNQTEFSPNSLNSSCSIGSQGTQTRTRVYKMYAWDGMGWVHPWARDCDMHAQLLSCVPFFAIPWTVAHQAPQSMGFPRQEYWSGLPFLPLEDLPNPGMEPRSPALQVDSLPTEPHHYQFSSVAQSCLTLCDSRDCIKPGFPAHHQLLELTQTHVHQVGDAIQPSHPLFSPYSPAFNLSQNQGLFQWVISSH